MDSPGSKHADNEPMVTVLTAGSTKQATPHYGGTTRAAIESMNQDAGVAVQQVWAPGRQHTPRAGCPAPCALCSVPRGCGEVSEDKGTPIHGDSKKILQGLTLALTKCLPLSFRVMVRSF